MLVIRLVNKEPDEALDAGADERAVDVRQMVADEQRAAARGHVFLADDADAVERMRHQPERETNEEFWNDAEHVHAGGEREDAEDEDDAIGVQSDPVVAQV